MQLDVNVFFDKIFYINLDSRNDRNELMIDNFKNLGITNYERVSGSVVQELPEPYQYRNFIKKNNKYVHGQLGCRQSHIKCVSLAKERGYKRIFILEDDVHFLEHPNKVLSNNHSILNDWDMLYFGGLVERFFRNQIVQAHAYCLNSIIFDDIIYMAESSGMEIDNFYAKIIQQMSYNYTNIGRYRVFGLNPFNSIIQNKKFNSDIA
jgi:GR25 family glycosyltransferase involved in LPS biosynthesis